MPRNDKTPGEAREASQASARGRPQQHQAATSDIRRGDPPEIGVEALRRNRAVVLQDYGFDVALADRRIVRVRRVKENLHGGPAAPLQVADEVVRDDEACVEIVAVDRVAEIAG